MTGRTDVTEERADDERRTKALTHVRELLLMHGATDQEIDRAVADGVIDLFVADLSLIHI